MNRMKVFKIWMKVEIEIFDPETDTHTTLIESEPLEVSVTGKLSYAVKIYNCMVHRHANYFKDDIFSMSDARKLMRKVLKGE